MFLKGYIPWNKGLTKNESEGLKRIGEVSRGNHYRKEKKASEETKQRIKEGVKRTFENGREHPKGCLGYHHTEDAKKRIGLASSNQVRSKERYKKVSKALLGRKLPEGVKEKISEGVKQYHKEHPETARRGALGFAMKMKLKRYCNTKPELEAKKILRILHIGYRHPYPVWCIEHCYPADFYLPKLNIILEVDGKHWHNYPDGLNVDKIRTQELIQKGYKVIRVWEDEIHKLPQLLGR